MIRSFSLAACLLLVIFFPGVARGQWSADFPPPDSPLWWTLTDDLTPAELRERLIDPEHHQLRLRDFLEGQDTVALSKDLPIDDIGRVKIWIDGRHDPQLFPMYMAFNAFASKYENLPTWREEARLLMDRHLISEQAQAHMLGVARSENREKRRVVEENSTQALRFNRLISEAEAKLGEHEAWSAVRRSDYPRLAAATGLDPATVRALHQVWRRQPDAEMGERALPRLRDKLSERDWTNLRAFLLAEIASGMSMIDLVGEGR